MSANKITIDPSLRSGDVTVKADPLTFNLDESELVDGPAAAIARAVAAGIRANGWSVTGKLASGIKAEPSGEGYAITAPPDRLTRDPKLIEKLAEDVPELTNPLADKDVQAAIEKSIDDAIKADRG